MGGRVACVSGGQEGSTYLGGLGRRVAQAAGVGGRVMCVAEHGWERDELQKMGTKVFWIQGVLA